MPDIKLKILKDGHSSEGYGALQAGTVVSIDINTAIRWQAIGLAEVYTGDETPVVLEKEAT